MVDTKYYIKAITQIYYHVSTSLMKSSQKKEPGETTQLHCVHLGWACLVELHWPGEYAIYQPLNYKFWYR